tara:strand:+ start:271 stop:1020 length:750 start_codon:yes stop_codon:yes gene_type:complete
MTKSKIKPTFSIITVVLNGEKYLEKTIKSVISQKEKLQYIIIDGGSTDNSLNIIKKYTKFIDYWVSEKDKGLYDAFNKGLKKCEGDFVGIINSDDIYTKNALSIIKKYLKAYPNIDFIFGSVKKHWGVLHGYRPKKILYSWGFYSSHSTGFFIKLKSAKKVGYYNTRYKYHADYDYFYRMIVDKKMSGISTKKNEIVGVFRRGGYSSKIPYRKLFYEEMKIRFDNGQNIFLLLIIAVYKIIKHFRKIIK